ncbi:Replication protein P, partial [Haemophilus influenzae]
KRTR